MRGVFGNFSRSISFFATLTISSILTIAAGAAINFAGGIPNGVLFLDADKNASSTSRILADGNSGSVTTTRLYLADGSVSNPSLAFANGEHGIYRSGVSIVTGVNGSAILTVGANSVTVAGTFLPNINNVRDIGSASYYWNDIFVTNVLTTNVTTTNVNVAGSLFNAPNLNALTATGDFMCQNNSTGFVQVQLANCTVSSAYFKKHIESLSSGEMMALIRKLRAVEYDMKADGKHEKGFVAEEVARIDPTLVVYTEPDAERLAWVKSNYPDVVIEKDGKTLIPQTVDYMRFTSVLTSAMQDIDDRLTKLESKQ